jgi:LmbE family N-acetylglucosaminyl deacetylase
MATLVCFHAHPDDEAITTAGLMARAAAAGHRVVLVAATAGERGEPQPGVLDPDEDLGTRRRVELAAASRVLGAEPPRFLGYGDSGMMGDPGNDDPACFWQADVEEAARRLADILDEVGADVLTVYDEHGAYGHPDHIQVHRVGHRAAALAGTPHVYEATSSREGAREAWQLAARELGGEATVDDGAVDDVESFGVPHADLSYALDVTDQLEAKRAAMAAHRSQISEQSFFLGLRPETFAAVFGTEWFAVRGRTGTGGPTFVTLLPGLDQGPSR